MKKAPKLSERLKTVFDMTPKSAAAADIGCDHAQLAVNLYISGKAARVFASDIREGPLAAARANIARFGCEEGVRTVLAPGLTGVIGEGVKVFIIAGMGGETIAKIIDEYKARITNEQTFILQPQSSVEDLRRYLCENGFSIEEERLSRDAGHIYTAMRVRLTGVHLHCPEVYYYIGKRLVEERDALLSELLARRIREHEKIRAGLLRSGQTERARETEELIDAMKKLREEIQSESP
ncbi:MAG: SAM-dependent methyltransferase [Clostridia bacterium]|nr:SAM-dependent methyltransferase [Clostridia bacterium]